MIDTASQQLVRRAETLYQEKLQAILEPQYLHSFVAIEPESGEYFLGQTLSEAKEAARKAYPDRLTHVMRIGHRAAIHLGLKRMMAGKVVACFFRANRPSWLSVGLLLGAPMMFLLTTTTHQGAAHQVDRKEDREQRFVARLEIVLDIKKMTDHDLSAIDTAKMVDGFLNTPPFTLADIESYPVTDKVQLKDVGRVEVKFERLLSEKGDSAK